MLAGRESAVLFELRGDHPGSVNVISEAVFRIGSDAENDLVLKDIADEVHPTYPLCHPRLPERHADG